MAISILATKLYIPPPPPKIVARPRLIDRLNEGLALGRKLTLVSAPAGFGKSTLISEWLAGCGRAATWLSLDDGDSDPTRFLIYLSSAVQKISPDSGAGIVDVLQSSQPPPIESILTALLNEFAAIPHGFILVLDDYHVLEASAIDEALTFLIEHLPPQIHLVITTREDPALPLPRLRARGQVTELRAADLRFTPAEAAGFLNQMMGLNLAADEVAILEARTEGWIAGLQLAALSMQDHRDAAAFIRAFSGDHRYIVDYLVEEVLKRQPESVRDFLLQTAILERLTGSLCEAVTGQSGGRARLETLQRGNFFLIPLDDKRNWYRYHYLFADVLRMHLMSEHPDQIVVLHQRASTWYEQNGSVADAIHHALAAKDFDRAADLIERAVPAMRQSRQEAALLRWLQALPDKVFQHRPMLNVHYAGTLLQNGQFEGVRFHLQEAERWLATPEDRRDQPIFVDEEDFRRLPGLVAMYRAALALAQGDVVNTMTHARRVLELARENDDFMRGAASSLLGLAYWTSGDLETAYQTFSHGMAYLQESGFISDVIGGSVTLADIRITQGRLREAMSIYEHGLQMATQPGGPLLRGAADMHVGLSDLFRERDDLQAATQHLLKSQELGELNGLPKNPYRWRLAMARIRQVEGDLEGALDLLLEAERVYMSDFSPNVRPVAAWRTRVWIAQGRLDEALGWAQERGLSAGDDLNYLREFEHITLVRLLMGRYQSEHSDQFILDAINLLERLLTAAEAGDRTGSVIEILVLLALAYQMQGNVSSALIPLQQALLLAEPEGYVRVFLDEGAPMRLLIADLRLRIEDHTSYLTSYVDKLLNAFGTTQRRPDDGPINNQKSTIQNLIEPLSQRELEVLRLFATDLSGPEIARELMIGLSTVRTHTKSIYSKLNVTNRRAAVQRAIELNLI